MLLGQQNEAGENKGKSSKFFPFIAKTLRFDSHDSNQTNPTHLKATPTQQKIIEESLKPVGLTMAFELGSPRQIHTETLNKIEPSKFLGQGSFGYVELLEISPLKKSNVSLFEELITEECLKLNGALPENVARKVFDMKKLVTPETDEQWNGMSETKICRNLRGEVYTEICEIEREVNLHNEASESDYVVKFFGWRVCEENKRVMLYMEACQQSLAAILKSGYRFSVSEMRKIAFCVATGLDHIHGLEIVHLDIKPDNLLLANDGRIKICDFGVSTKFNVTPADLRFTPTYVSPELFFINLKLQHLHIEFAQNRTSAKPLYFAKNEVRLFFADGSACKTDIWAFGVTLLELIVGACPFSLYSLREIRDKLASALVLAENEISTSFLDDLFDEATYLLEEGIGTYPGERESAPRFKYERDIVSFLQRFRDIQDISERNEVRRMLDFVRKTLIVDVEERFGADELLDQKFLAPIDLSDSKESDSLKKLLKTVEKEERRKKSKSTLLRRTKPINLRLLAKSL